MSPESPKSSRAEPRTVLLHWLLILLVALLETRAMWESSFLLWGHSAWLDATKVVVFNEAIRSGDWFPGWVPHLYFGHGSPVFLMYSPLAYFFTEIWVVLGIGIAKALKLTQFFALLFSGLGVYRLARGQVSSWAACLGALLYMLAPYRLVDMNVRHALAEHLAFVWFPLIVLGTERFVNATGGEGAKGFKEPNGPGGPKGLWLGAIATFALVLSHNISAMIGLPVCVVAGWVLASNRNGIRSLLMAPLPAILGVGTSAFFWWPALKLRRFVRAEDLTGGYFDFHHHFAKLRDLAASSWGFGQSGTADLMPLQLGWIHLAILGLALALLLIGRRSCPEPVRRWALAGLMVAFGSLFMCLGLSKPLWEGLPLIGFVQFPWRFLSLALLGTALCGAALIEFLARVKPRLEIPVFCAAAIALLLCYEPYYSTVRFIAADRHSKAIVLVPGAQFEEPAVRASLVSMEDFLSPEVVRSAGDGATSRDDFLPMQVREKPRGVASSPVVLENGEIESVSRKGLNQYNARVSMPEAGTATLSQFWFPGWQGIVDGHDTPVFASDREGLVQCQLPKGDHVLQFRYSAMAVRATPFWISSLSLALGLVGSVLWGRTKALTQM